MSRTIHDVLRELRESALDTGDLGDRFERLMKSYLLADPGSGRRSFEGVVVVGVARPLRAAGHRHRPRGRGRRRRRTDRDPVQVLSAGPPGLPSFDLIICDEAHRTTGVRLADGDESQFVKVTRDEPPVRSRRDSYGTTRRGSAGPCPRSTVSGLGFQRVGFAS